MVGIGSAGVRQACLPTCFASSCVAAVHSGTPGTSILENVPRSHQDDPGTHLDNEPWQTLESTTDPSTTVADCCCCSTFSSYLVLGTSKLRPLLLLILVHRSFRSSNSRPQRFWLLSVAVLAILSMLLLKSSIANSLRYSFLHRRKLTDSLYFQPRLLLPSDDLHDVP